LDVFKNEKFIESYFDLLVFSVIQFLIFLKTNKENDKKLEINT
jgi:hypothetical protein